MDTFPIPREPGLAAQLDDRLQAGSALLAPSIEAASSEIGQRLAYGDDMLGPVLSRLKRSVSGRVASGTRTLAPTVAAIASGAPSPGNYTQEQANAIALARPGYVVVPPSLPLMGGPHYGVTFDPDLYAQQTGQAAPVQQRQGVDYSQAPQERQSVQGPLQYAPTPAPPIPPPLAPPQAGDFPPPPQQPGVPPQAPIPPPESLVTQATRALGYGPPSNQPFTTYIGGAPGNTVQTIPAEPPIPPDAPYVPYTAPPPQSSPYDYQQAPTAPPLSTPVGQPVAPAAPVVCDNYCLDIYAYDVDSGLPMAGVSVALSGAVSGALVTLADGHALGTWNSVVGGTLLTLLATDPPGYANVSPGPQLIALQATVTVSTRLGFTKATSTKTDSTSSILPDISCGAPIAITKGIPAPGSAEWCAALPELHDAFTQLGNWLISWVSSNTPSISGGDNESSSFGDWLGGLVDLNPTTAPIKALTAVLGALPPKFMGDLKGAVSCWNAVVSQTLWCNASEILALSVVRSALRCLHHIRIGTDALLWLTIDIEVDISAAERTLDYLISAACPAEVPGAEEAIECWTKGTIDTPTLSCWMRMAGCNPDVWAPVVRARRERLTAEETIELGYRNNVPDDIVNQQLAALGWTDPADVLAKQTLYQELPGIADHLHWLQRNVFDSQYVADYGLLTGFEETFWPTFGPDLTAQGLKKRYAAYHYAAHWIQPSPGQLGEMLQRLRPGRVDPSVQFTEADFLRLLAEQDVAPYFRQRMRQVAYQQPALRFLRQLYDTAQVDDNELFQRFQDLGYNANDSRILTQSEAINRAKRRATTGKGYTPTVAAAIYVTGLYSKDDIYNLLRAQGWTRQETDTLCDASELNYRSKLLIKHKQEALQGYAKRVLDAYRVGTATAGAGVSALQKAGYDADSSAIMLQLQDLDAAIDIGKQAVAAVKRGYLGGEVTTDQAYQSLIGAGIADPRARQYVDSWTMLMTVPRVNSAGGKILGWLKKGLVTRDVAIQRLGNLGWSNADIEIELASAAQDIAKVQARIEQQKERQAEIAKAKLAALATASARQTKQLQADLRRREPPGKLVKWYGMGGLSEDVFRRKLSAEGYTDEEVSDYWMEAQSAREKCDAKKAKGKPC